MVATMIQSSKKRQLRKYWLTVKIGMYIIIPIFLLILPADYFDKGPSISLFEIFGVKDYYSKGITKSVMHLIHLNFEESWEYNKLGVLVLPLLSWVWARGFFRDLRKYRMEYLILPK